MDEKPLLDRACEILRSKGAEGDTYLERRRTLGLGVREGRLEEVSRAEVSGLAVRAMIDRRLGFVHTSKLDLEGVAAAAEKACEIGRFASQREDLLLAEPAGPGNGRDEGEALGLYDAALERQSITEKQEWMRAAEAAARAADPLIKRTDGIRWDETLGSYWLANTKGLYRHCRKSYFEAQVSVIAEDKGEMQPGEASFEGLRLADLPAPEELGRRAGERGARLLGGRPVPTGRYPVVFSPDAGWALLIPLSVALSGAPLSQGRSWLSPRLASGEDLVLGSSLVTIRDDGRQGKGPADIPFDAEGVDTRNAALLERGRLVGRLCDLASGKRLGIGSTGNSSREDYENLPDVRSHNLYLAPGEASPESIVASIQKGLWVWGLTGWWIGLDPSNPQFSSAAVGFWVEQGKPVRPVARVTVAGSLEEIFRGVEAVGSDLAWDHPTKTPTFRVREMTVSGE